MGSGRSWVSKKGSRRLAQGRGGRGADTMSGLGLHPPPRGRRQESSCLCPKLCPTQLPLLSFPLLSTDLKTQVEIS